MLLYIVESWPGGFSFFPFFYIFRISISQGHSSPSPILCLLVINQVPKWWIFRYIRVPGILSQKFCVRQVQQACSSNWLWNYFSLAQLIPKPETAFWLCTQSNTFVCTITLCLWILSTFFIEMDTLHILEDRAHNPTNQPDAGPQIYILFDFICECDEILKLYIQYTIRTTRYEKIPVWGDASWIDHK